MHEKHIMHEKQDQDANNLNANISTDYKYAHDHELVNFWLNEYIDSNNTYISYQQHATRFLLWLENNSLSIAMVNRITVQEYIAFLRDPYPKAAWCGVSIYKNHPNWKPFVKGLSPSSINLSLQIISSMYDYLVSLKAIENNPFKVHKLKIKDQVNKKISKFLTEREWNYIVEYIAQMPKSSTQELHYYHQIKWIFNLLYLTAARRSEVVDAKMSDFFNIGGKWWLKVIGKGNKYGEIPVTNDLLTALIEYRNFLNLPNYPSTNEHHLPLIFARNTIGEVDTSSSCRGVTSSCLYKIIKKFCTQVALDLRSTDPSSAFVIENVSTHWLRHTSATHQVNAGIDIRMVKENLRHSMLETTMRYQHIENDRRHSETDAKFGINNKKI